MIEHGRARSLKGNGSTWRDLNYQGAPYPHDRATSPMLSIHTLEGGCNMFLFRKLVAKLSGCNIPALPKESVEVREILESRLNGGFCYGMASGG